jgi:hypothetical protein
MCVQPPEREPEYCYSCISQYSILDSVRDRFATAIAFLGREAALPSCGIKIRLDTSCALFVQWAFFYDLTPVVAGKVSRSPLSRSKQQNSSLMQAALVKAYGAVRQVCLERLMLIMVPLLSKVHSSEITADDRGAGRRILRLPHSSLGLQFDTDRIAGHRKDPGFPHGAMYSQD